MITSTIHNSLCQKNRRAHFFAALATLKKAAYTLKVRFSTNISLHERIIAHFDKQAQIIEVNSYISDKIGGHWHDITGHSPSNKSKALGQLISAFCQRRKLQQIAHALEQELHACLVVYNRRTKGKKLSIRPLDFPLVLNRRPRPQLVFPQCENVIVMPLERLALEKMQAMRRSHRIAIKARI